MTATTIGCGVCGEGGEGLVKDLTSPSPALYIESEGVKDFSYSSLENNNTKVLHRNTKSYCLYPPCKSFTPSPFFSKTTGAFVKIKHGVHHQVRHLFITRSSPFRQIRNGIV